ncbi:MAG: ATP-binding cassette domain-containing protein, partial [Actinobacteria bacterium]|nr:ATP-binding cassette domain-containing protein [Actinomycetota bacterium]
GKSTAVKILTTLSRPDSGEAWVGGYSVLKDPAKVRRVIGVVAQNSGLDINATGRENLVLQGRVYGMSGPDIARQADELLKRVGIAEAADRVVRTYSGGMKRKLDVALGLMHKPQVLFLDEPTTGLDPEARVDMWTEIARLAGEEGLTILMTTHYLEEADHLAQRLAIVDRGRIVAEGTPDGLKGELRGDAIAIQLEQRVPVELMEAALEGVPGVREVTVEDRTVRARADVGASALPRAIAALEAQGMTAVTATVARPSLDDVYLRYAGRAFSQADAEVKS